jgi:hypothetical protein
MCQVLTPLARSSNARCIYSCEHGTIHLTWDVVTTYLDPETLVQVDEIIRYGQALQTSGHVQRGSCQLFYTQKGHFQLWIRAVGLALSPDDLEVLADLVQVALRQIGDPAAQKQPEQQTQVYQHTVKASVRRTFSNN